MVLGCWGGRSGVFSEFVCYTRIIFTGQFIRYTSSTAFVKQPTIGQQLGVFTHTGMVKTTSWNSNCAFFYATYYSVYPFVTTLVWCIYCVTHPKSSRTGFVNVTGSLYSNGVRRAQSSRAPLGCVWTSDLHRRCAANQCAALVWCYHVNMGKSHMLDVSTNLLEEDLTWY